MGHRRVASSAVRLGAAGAAFAVLAVLTPTAAFAGSDAAAPAEVVQTDAVAPATVPDSQPSPDSASAAAGDAPVGAPTEETAPSEETAPAAGPAAPEPPPSPADGAAQPARPAQAAADPEPSVDLRQFEKVGGEWQPSDGSVDFGNEIRYVLRIAVPAAQDLPGATLRSYVPGWDKAGDQVTNVPARLVAGSARCSVECEVEANENTGLVTWRLGDLVAGDQALEITAEFTARFGELPLDPQFDSSGMFLARAWCRGELSWSQPAARLVAAGVSPVYSNAVTATAVALEAIIGTPVAYPTASGVSATAGPTHGEHAADGASVLPDTGGPRPVLLAGGLALVVLGGLTVARARRS